jgi:hypothetical protein
MPQLHRWFQLEIITFYALIVSAVLYLLCASLFAFKRGDFIQGDREETDFLTWSEDIYAQFGLSTTTLVISVVVYIFQEYNASSMSEEDSCEVSPLKNTLITLISVHVI